MKYCFVCYWLHFAELLWLKLGLGGSLWVNCVSELEIEFSRLRILHTFSLGKWPTVIEVSETIRILGLWHRQSWETKDMRHCSTVYEQGKFKFLWVGIGKWCAPFRCSFSKLHRLQQLSRVKLRIINSLSILETEHNKRGIEGLQFKILGYCFWSEWLNDQ